MSLSCSTSLNYAAHDEWLPRNHLCFLLPVFPHYAQKGKPGGLQSSAPPIQCDVAVVADRHELKLKQMQTQVQKQKSLADLEF